MQRFRKILVGVELSTVETSDDGHPAHVELTPPSAEALRRAIWLAAHTRGELTIFTALEVSAHAHAVLEKELNHAPGDLEREAGEILDRILDRAKSEGIEARRKLAFGTPWQEICRQVLAEKHDLVVVGTRDVGQISRILFGSTGMKLLRNCPCPVWVTRPDPNWDDLNILVPSDFSDVSLEALRIAVNGGQLVETRLHLLHALEGQIGPPAWFGRVQRQIVEEYRATQRAEAKSRLHEQLALTDYRTLANGVKVHIVDGPPDEAILKAIDDFEIDLVVMGTAARGGLSSLVLGNTAERLISHMKCSIIAVKPLEFVCPLAADKLPGR
jgi:universal stress protein E